MNFDFTEEQKLFAESVRRFAQAHLAKDALKRAHDPRFPFDVAKLMSEQGLMGITIPEADGGQGGSLMDAVIAIEQIAAVCPRSADVVQFGNFGPIRTFAEYGTDVSEEEVADRMPRRPHGDEPRHERAGRRLGRDRPQDHAPSRTARTTSSTAPRCSPPSARTPRSFSSMCATGPASAASARCWSSAARPASPSARRRSS